MPALRSRVANDLLREQMLAGMRPRITLSFYRYFPISDPATYRDRLYQTFVKLEVFGRVYPAAEGINAQISVPDDNLQVLRHGIETFSSAG